MLAMNEKIRAEELNMTEVIQRLGSALKSLRVNSKQIIHTEMVAEDLLTELLEHKTEEAVVTLQVSRILGSVSVQLKCAGEAFALEDTNMGFRDLAVKTRDAEWNALIRTIVRKKMEMAVSVKNSGGINTARIQVEASPYRKLLMTLCAMLLGAAFGLLMNQFAPEEVTAYLSDNIFQTGYTMFLNAIKMVVCPMVFFSMAASVASFGDMRVLGRIGARVIIFSMIASAAAILIGYGAFQVLPVGNPGLAGGLGLEAAAVQDSSGLEFSIWDTLKGIIPANLLQAFVDADMLQILFAAVLLGAASAMIGKYVSFMRNLLDALSMLFSKAAALIIRLMPAAVFCSIARMVTSVPTGDVLSMLSWVGVVFVGCMTLLLFYAVIMLCFRLNPLKFFSKFAETMATTFSFGSSAATLPVALNTCRDRLGISPEICSFSIPLGSAIHKGGNCVTLIVSCLFAARVFQLTLSQEMLFSLMLSIFVFSVGAPGVPGGALVCLAMLLPQMGIPAEALSLFLGLYAIVGMMHSTVNITGNAVVSVLAARTENKLDKKVYNS